MSSSSRCSSRKHQCCLCRTPGTASRKSARRAQERQVFDALTSGETLLCAGLAWRWARAFPPPRGWHRRMLPLDLEHRTHAGRPSLRRRFLARPSLTRSPQRSGATPRRACRHFTVRRGDRRHAASVAVVKRPPPMPCRRTVLVRSTTSAAMIGIPIAPKTSRRGAGWAEDGAAAGTLRSGAATDGTQPPWLFPSTAGHLSDLPYVFGCRGRRCERQVFRDNALHRRHESLF